MEAISAEMIANRIKTRRETLGLSLQELSDKTGISKSTLQRYETGAIKGVPILSLMHLSDALNSTFDYLLGFSDAPGQRIATQGDIDRFDGEGCFGVKNLSADEAEAVEKLKRLPPESRKRIEYMIDYEYSEYTKELEKHGQQQS